MGESISDILSQGRDAAAQASKIPGIVIGIVTNIQDPDKLGRVKVKFPWLSDDVESWWARVAQPMTGQDATKGGFWFIPQVDDEVLVAFEHGDVRFPYVLGSLYNGVDKPPEPKELTDAFTEVCSDCGDPSGYTPTDLPAESTNGDNDVRFIRSRSGHMIMFDDKDGAEKIVITDRDHTHRIVIDTAEKLIVIANEDGDMHISAKNNMTIHADTLKIHTKTKMEFLNDGDWETDTTGDWKNTIGGDTKRETSGDEKAKAANIKLEGDSNFEAKAGSSAKVEGMSFEIKGSASGKVDGGGTLDVKGGMVNIN